MMPAVFAAAAAVTLVFMPYISNLLEASGASRENYLGEVIPTGMGIGFLPAVLSGNIILVFIKGTDTALVLLNILCFTVMSLVGIVDDLLGNGSVRGLKGHLKCLLGRRLTTGGLKAVIGGITAAFASAVVSEGLVEAAVNCILIMLFTNLINLLDLRPGRAVKSFFILWGGLYYFMPVREHIYILLPLAGCLAAYLPYDTGRKGMMGDAGANALGMSLGIYCCLGARLHMKLGITIVLILLHIAAERYSFTSVIDSNRVLKFIDGIGNKRSGGI